MDCAICEKRKPKRFCLAIHQRICPQCCGEQREVSLDCPRECEYLQQARRYEKPRPLATLDQSALFPQVEIGDVESFSYEKRALIGGFMVAMADSVRADRQAVDSDLIAALTALARSYETLVNAGLHYAPPLSSMSQQSIAGAIESSLKEYRKAEQTSYGARRLRDSDVLIVLVFLLRMALARTSGRPKSRSFVDFVLREFPDKPIIAPDEVRNQLILP